MRDTRGDWIERWRGTQSGAFSWITPMRFYWYQCAHEISLIHFSNRSRCNCFITRGTLNDSIERFEHREWTCKIDGGVRELLHRVVCSERHVWNWWETNSSGENRIHKETLRLLLADLNYQSDRRDHPRLSRKDWALIAFIGSTHHRERDILVLSSLTQTWIAREMSSEIQYGKCVSILGDELWIDVFILQEG